MRRIKRYDVIKEFPSSVLEFTDIVNFDMFLAEDFEILDVRVWGRMIKKICISVLHDEESNKWKRVHFSAGKSGVVVGPNYKYVGTIDYDGNCLYFFYDESK